MTIPPTSVTILTGFLGSGKTTLLSRLLRTPAFARTAVIVNEFGEVGLDHDLLEPGDENIVELNNGCICCAAQSDLSRILSTLHARREAQQIAFTRVVIETSGTVDPVPVLQMIATDRAISRAFAVDRLVTTVDVIAVHRTIEDYEEARSQIALADLILMTKTDLATVSDVDAVKEVLSGLNQLAPVMKASDWEGSMGSVQSNALASIGRKKFRAFETRGTHARSFTSASIIREQPVSATAVLLFLEGLVAHESRNLLRVKGIVQLAEDPERPMLLHGVRQMIHQPSWLQSWPSDDHRTRIVLIGHDLSERWANLLFDALAEEAAEMQRVETGERQTATTGAVHYK